MRLLDETTHDRGALFEEMLVGLRASSQVMTVDVFEGDRLQRLRKNSCFVYGEKEDRLPLSRFRKLPCFTFSVFLAPEDERP